MKQKLTPEFIRGFAACNTMYADVPAMMRRELKLDKRQKINRKRTK